MFSRRTRLSFSLRSLIGAGLVGVLLLATAGGAHAARPSVAPDARIQVQTLVVRMEQATEAYDAARQELTTSQAKAAKLTKQMEGQQRSVRALQVRVDSLANAAYRGMNFTKFNAMFSSSGPQAVLDQLATLQHLSKDERAEVIALQQARRTLTEQRTALVRELDLQTRREATLLAKKKAIEADLATWKARVATIDVLQRASRSQLRRSLSPDMFPNVPGTGRGAVALRFAYAQMGKPYSWGASGPGSYDCSGLTMRSWQAAGVSLPHSSRMQYASSPHISRSQLRPGDLVFFGSPISHVGIFVGGDTIIGAPTTGDVVRYQRISSMPYAGATRPG